MKTIMHIARKYEDVSETLISTLMAALLGMAILGIAPAVIMLSV